MSDTHTEAHRWILSATGAPSIRQAASLLASRGVSVSNETLARQVRADSITAELAIAVARACELSVVGSLVANHHLTEAEAGLPSTEQVLRGADDDQIIYEVGRRLGLVRKKSAYDQPVSTAIRTIEESRGNVTRMRPADPDDTRGQGSPRDIVGASWDEREIAARELKDIHPDDTDDGY